MVTQEDIFTALLNNHKIVEEQKLRVTQLAQEVNELYLILFQGHILCKIL